MTALVAVVVPVRADDPADERVLSACLDALAGQALPAAAVETVVVDDGSRCDLGPVVTGRAGVRLLRPPPGGPYAARNAGVRATAAPVVAFTDADCLPEPGWLACALQTLDREPGLAAVAGAIEVPVTSGCGAVAWHDALTAFPQRQFVERHGFGATANLVVRRAAFDAVGVFDPALRSGGDAEWGARATAAGLLIGYRDEVRVRHPPRRTLRAVTRKAVRVTRGVEELAAARGDADPLARTLLDRLGRPVRELPLLRRAPRARFLPVLAVACTQAVLIAAETARMRLVLRRRAAGRT